MILKPSNFEPLIIEEASKMELKDNRDIIIELKKAKKEKELTLPRLEEMLRAQKKDVAMTTLKRVFREGSEDNDSFNYASTLKPLAELLLDENNDGTSISAVEIANLKADIKVKEQTIDRLPAQIDSLHIQMQNMREEETKRLNFMKTQIELKDKRMDTKDELIQRVMDRNDKKDKAIAELMEENKRLDEDIRKLLEKCQACEKK